VIGKLAVTTLMFLVPCSNISADAVPAPKIVVPVVRHLVTPAIMAKWAKVAQCESGSNWSKRGRTYSGGLGFRNDVWAQYGSDIAPNASQATPEQQVVVALRINTSGFVPDQDGKCRNW